MAIFLIERRWSGLVIIMVVMVMVMDVRGILWSLDVPRLKKSTFLTYSGEPA